MKQVLIACVSTVVQVFGQEKDAYLNKLLWNNTPAVDESVVSIDFLEKEELQ